jgi:hypothetical protein
MTPTQSRRRQLLVDPRLQWSIALPVVLAVLVTVLPFVGMLLLIPGGRQEQLPESSQQAFRMSWLTTGGYFGLVLGVMLLALLRATHRIAGPILVIERGLRGLAAGDDLARLTIRQRDAAQGLSQAACLVRQCLVDERAMRRRLLLDLEAQLAAGDLQSARTRVAAEREALAAHGKKPASQAAA